MCLAVPGEIIAVRRDRGDPVSGCVGTVEFQGSRIEVCLAMTPQADVGDWVLVHAGFALTVVDEAEARETWEYLSMAGVGEMPQGLRDTQPPGAGQRPLRGEPA